MSLFMLVPPQVNQEKYNNRIRRHQLFLW